MAAERNLDVRAEFYNPAQFEADIHRNRSIYDPLLSLDTTYADTTQPAFSSANTVSGQSFDVNASLSQLFWTGGTASAVFMNNYSKTDSFFANEPHFGPSQLDVPLQQHLPHNTER